MWQLVYVDPYEPIVVFAPFPQHIDWKKIGSGSDLECYEPGPSPFVVWTDHVGVREAELHFESFVGRRTDESVTRSDELHLLLAPLPMLKPTTLRINIIGIAQTRQEKEMVVDNTPSHIESVVFMSSWLARDMERWK